ncbi:MAG: beta strand repeat-containing protein, partial [Isosphaeraceae bacterium]
SAATTVTINLTGDNSLIQLGDPTAVLPSAASANLATFDVSTAANTANSVDIDDSSSAAVSTYTVGTGTGTLTGPGINLVLTGPAFGSGITLKGSSAADTYNVLSTFSGEPVNIVGGAGHNIVNVGSAANKLATILSPVTVSDPSGSMTLNLLDSGDTTGTGATITGLAVTGLDFGAGGLVNYTGVTTATGGVTALNVTDGSTLVATYIVDGTSATTTTLSIGSGADTVDVELTGTGAPLTINGDGADTVNVGSEPATPASSTLGGIKSLVTVNDLGSATLNLLDAGDTTTALPATITGSLVSGWGFGAGGSVAYTGVIAPATGGVTALNLDGGTSTSGGVIYNFNSTSTNTTLNGDPDTVNITAAGLAAGTTLTINDTGATVNYTAPEGSTPVVTAGAAAGDVIIALTGHGTVDANGIAQLNLLTPISVTITPILVALPFNTVEGFNLVDAIVATFTAPVTPALPTGTGVPASFFTATINWGDGPGTPPTSDLTAGTITQDAENPSVYDVTGTHTFVDNGSYTVGTTVFLSAGTQQQISSLVNGVPVTAMVHWPASPSTPPTATATATVTQGPLAVTAFPIVGTEGTAIAAGPIATFIDAGGADPVGDYSATITIVDPATGLPVAGYPVTLPAGSITQNANAAQYTVTALAPLPALPEEGTYQVVVSVTDDASANPITASGPSTAVIADADLTAGAVTFTPPAPTTGAPVVIAGGFTDANTGAPASDFSAVIDWGDGSPTSLGTVTGTGGTYSVGGTHTYAKPGTYNTTINVVDDGGETVTLTGAVTAANPALTVTSHDFNAVEGTDSGAVLLATIIDPNTSATVSDVSATLTTWGDGTPAAPITVPLSLVGHTAPGVTPAGIIFEVRAGHNYHEEGAFTFSITVQTLGTGDAPFTVTGTANVADASLSSSNGTEIAGTGITEGNPTGTVVLGTFHDANPFATAADFTATVPIGGWGDTNPALAPETLTVTQVSPPATPGTTADSVFEITGSHTYLETGTYAITINVADVGGSTTVISDSAIIADAPLADPGQTPIATTEASIFPVPVFGAPGTGAPPQGFVGQVAIFNDGNPTATIADFKASIDWGDGTAPTAGTIVAPVAPSTAFQVDGSHIYADAGTGVYKIQVLVTDDDGSTLTIPNVANVADDPINVIGTLNPASDSGKFNNDAITNVTQPDFFGFVSEGHAHVSLTATDLFTGVATSIGTVQADSAGSWNIKSIVALPNSSYTITATAVDQFGVTATAAPVTIVPELVIDTVGPRITDAAFNRLTGTATFTFQDFQQDGVTPGGSGLLVQSLSDAANYSLNRVLARPAGTFIVTSITVTPGATPGSDNVTVVFNNGAPIKGGYFQIIARAESVLLPAGIQDVAGNALDGEFYGQGSASGNGVPGGNFVANIKDIHQGTLGFGNSGPITIIGTPHPNDPAGNFRGTTKPVKATRPVVVTKTKAKVKVTTPAKVRVVVPAKLKLAAAKAAAAARRKK